MNKQRKAQVCKVCKQPPQTVRIQQGPDSGKSVEMILHRKDCTTR